MKATDLLEKQHRKVEAIFKKLEGGRSDNDALLTELANDLAAHMVIEQELFYPAAMAAKEDLVLEAYEEHAVAEFALKRLLSKSSDDATFKAKLVTLKELIEHHVKEEEEELFPKVEKVIPAAELTALGKQMKARFDEVVESGYEAVLSASKSKSSKSGKANHSASSERSRAAK